MAERRRLLLVRSLTERRRRSGKLNSAFSIALLLGPPVGGMVAEVQPKLAFALAGEQHHILVLGLPVA